MTGVFIKKEIWRLTDTEGKMVVGRQAEIGVGKTIAKDCQPPAEAERARKDSSPEHSEGAWPC